MSWENSILLAAVPLPALCSGSMAVTRLTRSVLVEKLLGQGCNPVSGFELAVVQAAIEPARLQKLVVRALLHDIPVVHDQDLVGGADC